MRKLLLATSAAALLIGSAGLALADEDTSAPPPAMAAPAANAVDWTGPYLGLAAGYDFGHVRVRDLDSYNGPPPIAYDPDGVNIAGLAGYNWQAWPSWDPNLIIGMEGELGWFGLKGDAQYPPYIGVRLPTDSRAAIDGGVMGALAARLGYAIGPWLLFAKAGVAAADTKLSFIDNDPTGTTLVSGTTNQGIHSAYLLGAGVEFMFAAHWSSRIEYDYYDFGDINHTATSAGGTAYRFRHQVTSNAVRAAIAYHW